MLAEIAHPPFDACSSPPIEPISPPRGVPLDDGPEPAPPPVGMSGVRIVLEDVGFHPHRRGTPEDIITNLKFFTVKVALTSKDGTLVQPSEALRLKATLLYESGDRVVPFASTSPGPVLLGDTAQLVLNGRARFRLKVNPQAKVTSDLHQKRRFVVSIGPEGLIGGLLPPSTLTVRTPPFRVMTRIWRLPSDPVARAKAEAALAASEQAEAPSPAEAPSSTESPSPTSSTAPSPGSSPRTGALASMSHLLARTMVGLEKVEVTTAQLVAQTGRVAELVGVIDKLNNRVATLEDGLASQAASIGALQLALRRQELLVEKHLTPLPPLPAAAAAAAAAPPPKKRPRRG